MESETNINENIPNNIANWRLLKSGFHGEINLGFAAEIYWDDDLLNLNISAILLSYEKYIASASWHFQGLEPIIYQLRLLYDK